MFSNRGGSKPSGNTTAPRISHSTIRNNYISANTKTSSTSNGPRPTASYGTEKPGTTFVRKY